MPFTIKRSLNAFCKALGSRISGLYHAQDNHTKDVIHGASSAFILRVSAAVLSFVLSIVLTRMLGVGGVGAYFLALSVVSIATILGRVGLDNALLRFAAASKDAQDWVALRGLYSRAIGITTVASGLLAATIFLLAPWLGSAVFTDPGVGVLLSIVAPAIVPIAIYTVLAQLLQGVNRTKRSIAVLNLWPSALGLIGSILLIPGFGVQGAAEAFTAASFLTLLIGWWNWRRAMPHLSGVHGHFAVPTLLKSSMPLFWASISQIVITLSATIMLGMWSTSVDVGLYGAAGRGALLITFVVQAVTSIASPKFSVLYNQGSMSALGNLARNSSALLTLAASPFLIIFWQFPEIVMRIFGAEFVIGASVLSILAIGQAVNVITGPAGNVLMMCGYERLVRNVLLASATICLIANLILIPRMGAVGAAIANSATVTFENLTMVVLVWRKFGIMTIPMPQRIRNMLGATG